jgi:hypothetical protein
MKPISRWAKARSSRRAHADTTMVGTLRFAHPTSPMDRYDSNFGNGLLGNSSEITRQAAYGSAHFQNIALRGVKGPGMDGW